jgi:hypothetical protein
LEKLIYKRLIKYIEEMDILFDNQLGFRFWVSPHAVQAVTLITDQIQKAVLNKKYSSGLFWHGKS